MLSAISKSAPYMSGVIGGLPSHCAPSSATAAGRKATASREPASSSAAKEGARRGSLAPAHAIDVKLPLIVARWKIVAWDLPFDLPAGQKIIRSLEAAFGLTLKTLKSFLSFYKSIH
jgi:hypothetical protein